MNLNQWTFIKIVPVLDGMNVEYKDEQRDHQKVWFDTLNLTHVNFIRESEGKKPLPHLNGYCMSTGCSCRNPVTGAKGRPDCGLFKCYDDDGIKKDFVYQILGI